MSNEFADIGKELIETSKEASSARGIVEELFPYIYVASKRMSVRAISRWLTEEKNIKLSHVSISKALRNPDQYFEAIVDNIWPAALLVARECNCTVSEVLYEDLAAKWMSEVEEKNRSPRGTNSIELEIWDQKKVALKKLISEWYKLPVDVQIECSRFVGNYEFEDER